MGLPEIQALKGVPGAYKGGEPTSKILASMKPKAKKPIAKRSKKALAKIDEEKELFEQDKAFYAEIWAASPHKCEACKTKLPKEPLTIFFHHALPKSAYPGFRHLPENIIILCPSCHNQVETDINKVPYVKNRTEQIKRELLG